jgi:hypothetical protein
LRALALAVLLTGCAAPRVSFDYLAGHFLVVPVRVDDQIDTRFVFDTGIGLNLISQKLCARLGCRIDGEHTGRRMSGQAVRIPLTTVPSLGIGGRRLKNVRSGVLDFEAHHFGIDPSISGFLSLDFFADQPFTIDYRDHTVQLIDARTLRIRRAHGTVLDLRVDRQGPSLCVFAQLTVAAKRPASVEIDTGSPALTLDERYLDLLGLVRDGDHGREVNGSDETGYTYARYFLREPIRVDPSPVPTLGLRPIRVMFQKIIYDGLVGDAFLRQFVVTFDLAHAQIIFEKA